MAGWVSFWIVGKRLQQLNTPRKGHHKIAEPLPKNQNRQIRVFYFLSIQQQTYDYSSKVKKKDGGQTAPP